MTYYINYNRYGSDTSVGFDNTNQIAAVATKAEKDALLAKYDGVNLSVRAVKAPRNMHPEEKIMALELGRELTEGNYKL